MSNKKHKQFINGPVNVIRLEGKINNITKILYTFMDIHEDVSNQTKCADLRSNDIMQYLIKNFDEISEGEKIYDFFFEIQPTSTLRTPNIMKKNISKKLMIFF
jgi:hypothetical protein